MLRELRKSHENVYKMIENFEDDEKIFAGVEDGERFPWRVLKIGQSFLVGYKEMRIDTIRREAIRVGNKTGRKFLVFDNPEEKAYEVARVDGKETLQDSESVVIYSCSEKAAEKITSYTDTVGTSDDLANSKYPWRRLKIGQCFTIPIGEVEQSTVRGLASSKGKLMNKKFTVIRHDDQNLYEVARIA